jgi:hypothetical protein
MSPPRQRLNARPSSFDDLDPEDVEELAAEWLYHEARGAKLRSAHRCIEWDGWEEGLVESILGPAEQEDEWFAPWEDVEDADSDGADGTASRSGSDSPVSDSIVTDDSAKSAGTGQGSGKRKAKRPPFATSEEREKEKLLNATGDICGGRGGELGRRLEHWLREAADGEKDETLRKWAGLEDGAAGEAAGPARAGPLAK